MSKKVSYNHYVKEILKCAEYRRGSDVECIIATASILPGCITQGENFEEARDNLIDAIQLWITVGLREGEKMPVVNGCQLASAYENLEEIEDKEFIYG